MDEKKLQEELQSQVQEKLSPLFSRYSVDFSGLESVLKWKPIVLMIGNYSSGKSTLINELLGQDIQRTGQAPTDDSFTIITSDSEEEVTEITGATLVNDESLPFSPFKAYGERFISHFSLKLVDNDLLSNMAIIDSPGMLDSVTEKDRGYEFLSVLGEFARLADLVVLMFDPHKAGTIKETYNAIRSTLPESSAEDRIVFVMNRIDECENLSDLVRSFGALCWNLSQMTGRKDIPYVYLTYAPTVAGSTEQLASWEGEREDLKRKILKAPGFRIYHILEDIDQQVSQLEMVCEAMAGFAKKGRRLVVQTSKIALIVGLFFFFMLGPISKLIFGVPEETLIGGLLGQHPLSINHLLFPVLGFVLVLFFSWYWFSRFGFQGLKNKWSERCQELITLDTAYKRDLWRNIEDHTRKLISRAPLREIWARHSGNLKQIRGFLHKTLKTYYHKIKSKQID
ncbi:MAG: dynamin family protein [Desulfurivibrionaceae bacterium]